MPMPAGYAPPTNSATLGGKGVAMGAMDPMALLQYYMMMGPGMGQPGVGGTMPGMGIPPQPVPPGVAQEPPGSDEQGQPGLPPGSPSDSSGEGASPGDDEQGDNNGKTPGSPNNSSGEGTYDKGYSQPRLAPGNEQIGTNGLPVSVGAPPFSPWIDATKVSSPPSRSGGGGGGGGSGNTGAGTGSGITKQIGDSEASRNAGIQANGQFPNPLGGYPNSGAGSSVGGMGGMPAMGGSLGPALPTMMTPPGNNAAAGALLGNAANSFQTAQNQANTANTDRANQIGSGFDALSANSANTLGGLSGLFGKQQDQFANTAGNVNQGYQQLQGQQGNGFNDLINSLSKGYQGVGQGYDNVSQQIMNNLSLLGSTQQQDINQAYQQQGAKAQQDLVDRGLGNTTIKQSVDRGIGLDRQRALMGNAANTQQMVNSALMQTAYPQLQFGERAIGNVGQVQQQGIGANTGLAQNALQQQYGGGQDLANLQGQALNFGQNANATQNQLGQNQLGFMERINQTGPDYQQLAQLMMAIGQGGTGYGQNGYNAIPSSVGNVAPSPNYGAIQAPAFNQQQQQKPVAQMY